MHIRMVKKRLRDGSECRKCAQAVEQLATRGLLDRIDEVIWAVEDDPQSPGMRLGAEFGVDTAPFFVVSDGDDGDEVYTSVMRLIKERLGAQVSGRDEAAAIDPDDVGGI